LVTGRRLGLWEIGGVSACGWCLDSLSAHWRQRLEHQ
jgi:hypothetical protein